MATKEALGMSLEISQDYIDNLTKDLLTQSLIETLDAKNSIVEGIVSQILSVKVNDKGQIDSWSSENKYTFLEYLVRKMIRDEVKSVAEEVLNEKRDDIRKAIRREMSSKATIDKFCNAFFSSVVDGLEDRYKTTIDVTVEREKELY